MFFTYTQNDSGGYLIGPEYIIIEADTKEESNEIFNNLELDHESRDCCSSRWYEYSASDGYEQPTIFGGEISDKFKEIQLDLSNEEYDTYCIIRK
jgi:hypothetical protein